VVVENEAKRPSVGVLIISTPPDHGEAKNELLQFLSKHVQTLIELAGIYQDSPLKVGNDLAQRLWRTSKKGHQ